LEAVRQYQLHLTQERKLSPQSINTFVSAVQFLYLVTLEMPWDKHDFPRARLDQNLPVVLLTCCGSGLRISEAVALKISDIDGKRCSSPQKGRGYDHDPGGDGTLCGNRCRQARASSSRGGGSGGQLQAWLQELGCTWPSFQT
jgi:integrase